jgi:hypothetical protein
VRFVCGSVVRFHPFRRFGFRGGVTVSTSAGARFSVLKETLWLVCIPSEERFSLSSKVLVETGSVGSLALRKGGSRVSSEKAHAGQRAVRWSKRSRVLLREVFVVLFALRPLRSHLHAKPKARRRRMPGMTARAIRHSPEWLTGGTVVCRYRICGLAAAVGGDVAHEFFDTRPRLQARESPPRARARSG